MFLVKFDGNYADEFDCHGFCVLYNRNVYDEFVATFEQHEKELEVYFGTNECFYWDNGRDMLRYFSIVEISKRQAAVLTSLLYPYEMASGYGICPFWKLAEWFD